MTETETPKNRQTEEKRVKYVFCRRRVTSKIVNLFYTQLSKLIMYLQIYLFFHKHLM